VPVIQLDDVMTGQAACVASSNPFIAANHQQRRHSPDSISPAEYSHSLAITQAVKLMAILCTNALDHFHTFTASDNPFRSLFTPALPSSSLLCPSLYCLLSSYLPRPFSSSLNVQELRFPADSELSWRAYE